MPTDERHLVSLKNSALPTSMMRTTSDIQARKQTLRQRIIALRDASAALERSQWSQRILRRLTGMALYRKAQVVLGFMNFGSEWESAEWVKHALAEGKHVLLPRVNKANRQLDLYEIRDADEDVAPGAYGIREPLVDRCKPFEALAEIDLILLPGIAFDRTGGRLGYGGGFFDRLLSCLPHQPHLIAGAFALQVVEHIPQEPTDHRVHILVTEHETIRCNFGREGR